MTTLFLLAGRRRYASKYSTCAIESLTSLPSQGTDANNVQAGWPIFGCAVRGFSPWTLPFVAVAIYDSSLGLLPQWRMGACLHRRWREYNRLPQWYPCCDRFHYRCIHSLCVCVAEQCQVSASGDFGYYGCTAYGYLLALISSLMRFCSCEVNSILSPP